jgi:hypothetical protein
VDTTVVNTSNYEKQFLKGVGVLLITCSLVAMVFIYLSIKNPLTPFKDVTLDGQTLASYVALVLGTTVAFAGSWVAIRIAQAAHGAQETANRLQSDEMRLHDPSEVRTREFIAQSRALRLNTISAIARSTHVLNSWGSFANKYAAQLAQQEGLVGVVEVTDLKLPKAVQDQAMNLANKHMQPVFTALAVWMQADVTKEINSLTPLVLTHSMVEKSEESNAVAKRWLASCNALALGIDAIIESNWQRGLNNLIGGCEGIDEILSHSRLADHDYVLGLVRTSSTERFQKLKDDLGPPKVKEE